MQVETIDVVRDLMLETLSAIREGSLKTADKLLSEAICEIDGDDSHLKAPQRGSFMQANCYLQQIYNMVEGFQAVPDGNTYEGFYLASDQECSFICWLLADLQEMMNCLAEQYRPGEVTE